MPELEQQVQKWRHCKAPTNEWWEFLWDQQLSFGRQRNQRKRNTENSQNKWKSVVKCRMEIKSGETGRKLKVFALVFALFAEKIVLLSRRLPCYTFSFLVENINQHHVDGSRHELCGRNENGVWFFFRWCGENFFSQRKEKSSEFPLFPFDNYLYAF